VAFFVQRKVETMRGSMENGWCLCAVHLFELVLGGLFSGVELCFPVVGGKGFYRLYSQLGNLPELGAKRN
jgi:hypothetical protein